MKTTTLRSLLLTALLIGIATTGMAATKALFLTGGQSNTDGRLTSETLPTYLQSANERALVSYHAAYSENRLGVFSPYYPTSGNTGQPGRWAYDAVTYYYIGQALGETFYVAKTSYGGTSIDPSENNSPSNHSNSWLPQYGSGYHWSADPTFLAATTIAGTTFEQGGTTYDGQSMLLAWIANIDAAIDAITDKGDTPDIKAIIWHQGESDKNSAGNYYNNLKAMVAYVRQHLVTKTGNNNYATLPFFCGTIPHASSLYNSTVEKAFFTLEDEDANFHTVDLRDLTMLSDTKHFDAPSAELFGKRLYNRMVDEGVVAGSKLDVAYAEVDYSDFGTDEYVGATTTWSFDNQSGSFYSGTQIVNSMYLHGGGSTQRKFEYVTGQTAQTLTYPDSYVQNATSYVRSNYSSNTTEASISDSWNASRSAGNCIGVNVLYPGTFTLKVAIEEAGKIVKLFFNGKNVATATCETANTIQEMTYTATKAGTYYVWSNTTYKLWGARYVPTTDRTSQRTITTDADGYAPFGNLSGAPLSLPTGLTAWAVAPSTESDEKVEMTQLTTINRGDAALLKGTPSTQYVLPFAWGGVEYDFENDMTAQQTTGNVEETSGEDFINYLFANKTFTKADGIVSVAAGSAYLSISNGAAHCANLTLTFDEPEADALTAPAHDFGTEVVVGEATTWNFENCTLGNVDGVFEKNGMYYRNQPGLEGRSFYSASNSTQVSFEDGTQLTPSKKVGLNNDPTGGTQINTNSTAVNENFCDYFAINALYPGKFSVLVSINSAKAATTNGTIYVNGTSTGFTESGTGVVEWSVTTAEAATILFHPTNPIYVYAIRYVPTIDNIALRQATMNSEGYATFTNIALAPLTLPEGLEAYALLPGDIDDDATKKVGATVIGKGEAVLLKGTADETYTLTIDNTQESDVDDGNLLEPVLAWQKPLANNTETGNVQYVFGGNLFTKADGQTKVYQKQAILSVPSTNVMANYNVVKLTPAVVEYNYIDSYTKFGNDEVVWKETTWLCKDFGFPASYDKDYSKATGCNNGLYYNDGGSSNRSWKNANQGSGNYKFADGTSIAASNTARSNGANPLVTPTSSQTASANISCDFAINAAVPGTFSILKSGDATGYLYFNGTKVAELTTSGDSDMKELSYTSTEAGTFVYVCGGTSNVAAMRFVPTNNDNIYTKVTPIGWGSMSLPYPAVVPDGTCVYYVSDYEDGEETGTLTLTKVNEGEVIPAKQGFLFNGMKGLYCFEKSMSPGSWDGNMLVGTADAELTGYDSSTATDPIYVLAKMDDNTAGFKKFSGTSIAQYKAYLLLETTPAARAFRFVVDDGTNAVNPLSSAATGNVESVYSLGGTRQNSLRRGINIVRYRDGNVRKVNVK